MRYFIPLFVLALLLTACRAESVQPTLPPTEPPTEQSSMLSTQEPTTVPTEAPTEEATEPMTEEATHAPKPTLPGDESYLKQCVQEYVESRFAYLSGEDVQVPYASAELMETIEATRQDLMDQGITLVDFKFDFGDIYYANTRTNLQVWRTVTYSIDGQETTTMIICDLVVAPDDQGNLVVTDDSQFGNFGFTFGG